jgi:hypothetical protein
MILLPIGKGGIDYIVDATTQLVAYVAHKYKVVFT